MLMISRKVTGIKQKMHIANACKVLPKKFGPECPLLVDHTHYACIPTIMPTKIWYQDIQTKTGYKYTESEIVPHPNCHQSQILHGIVPTIPQWLVCKLKSSERREKYHTTAWRYMSLSQSVISMHIIYVQYSIILYSEIKFCMYDVYYSSNAW